MSKMLKSLFLVSLVILAASCIQSVKIPSFGGSDAGAQKPCARLSHPETGEQLELHSLREKKLLEAGWSGAFSSFTVMDGCQLSLWADPREWSESRSFPRGVYPNQLLSAVGSFSSYQCTCDDPIKNKNFRNFKRRHLASKNEQGSDSFCTTKVRQRRKTCQPINSFVFSNPREVISVCRNAGVQIPNSNLYKSTNLFRMVDCKKTDPNANPPNCIYTAENTNEQRYIILECNQRKLPIHFEGSEAPSVFGFTDRV